MRLNLKKMSGAMIHAGALVLMLAIVGFSQGPPQGPGGPPDRGFRGGPGGPPRDGLGPIARDLNLTDEQKAQIKKINESFAESTKSLREQLRTLHESQGDINPATFDE